MTFIAVTPEGVGSGTRAICRAQSEERDHARLEFLGCQSKDVAEGEGMSDLEASDDCAAERGEMRAAAELFAEVVSECANVGSLGAAHREGRERFGVGGEVKIVDVNESWGSLNLDAFSGKFVEGHAVALDRGDHGRELHEIAGEGGSGFVEFRERKRRYGQGGGQFALGVVG